MAGRAWHQEVPLTTRGKGTKAPPGHPSSYCAQMSQDRQTFGKAPTRQGLHICYVASAVLDAEDQRAPSSQSNSRGQPGPGEGVKSHPHTRKRSGPAEGRFRASTGRKALRGRASRRSSGTRGPRPENWSAPRPGSTAIQETPGTGPLAGLKHKVGFRSTARTPGQNLGVFSPTARAGHPRGVRWPGGSPGLAGAPSSCWLHTPGPWGQAAQNNRLHLLSKLRYQLCPPFTLKKAPAERSHGLLWTLNPLGMAARSPARAPLFQENSLTSALLPVS